MPIPRFRNVTPETRAERLAWVRVRRAESAYARSLRQVAMAIGTLVSGADLDDLGPVLHMLENYSRILDPWARSTASRMLADVSRRDQHNWNRIARTMTRELRAEIESAPTGLIFKDLLAGQVSLITSLPLDAAQRVHTLATERMVANPVRAAELAKDIFATGKVTIGRANLIARTETARVASNLVEARARHVGSEGYIWRTSEDSDVRKEHRVLNGTYHRWDEPPIAGSKGERAHAGTIYNCRCYPEPVIPDNV